jgi:hypothetical protein
MFNHISKKLKILWGLFIGFIISCMLFTIFAIISLSHPVSNLFHSENAPIIEWQKTYGGRENDMFVTIKKTFDNCFVILGTTESYGAGSKDVYLVKITSEGDVIWTKTYGDEYKDVACFLEQTQDSGFTILGYANTPIPNLYEIFDITVDKNGELENKKIIGIKKVKKINMIQKTMDRDYIIVGTVDHLDKYKILRSDIHLAKLDSIGTIQWEKNYGGDCDDEANTILQTEDGSYILGGYSWRYKFSKKKVEFTTKDLYYLNVDSLGKILWETVIGLGGKYKCNGLCVDVNENIFATGTQTLGHGTDSTFFALLNSEGTPQNVMHYDNKEGSSNSIIKSNNGNFIIIGSTVVLRFKLRYIRYIYLLKLNRTGEILWENAYGGLGWQNGKFIIEADDGGYIAAGNRIRPLFGNLDIYIFKLMPKHFASPPPH